MYTRTAFLDAIKDSFINNTINTTLSTNTICRIINTSDDIYKIPIHIIPYFHETAHFFLIKIIDLLYFFSNIQ